MSLQHRLSLGALSRLGLAGVAAYLGSSPADPNVIAALAAVAVSYLTNRATHIESESEDKLLGSKNDHIQLALAGAFRACLDELAPSYTTHKPIFDSWDVLLDAALDEPATLLPIVVPAEFDQLLDVANPYIESSATFNEAEVLLRFWLGCQRIFERTNSYPVIPPSDLPELPADLHESLKTQFVPAFQRAFANLLVCRDSKYARRAFECRHLQELVAASRRNTEILERLDAQFVLPLAPLRPPDPLDETREIEVLRAENRAIPIFGRESDLGDLHAWLNCPALISCRILVGPAGAGKTRLAIQLMEDLRTSTWRCGFLRQSDLPTAPQRRWDTPTLAIVDYAATVVQHLRAWLAHLADQQPVHPLRILLLEREANTESGWLRFLIDRTSVGYRIGLLVDPSSPHRVSPLGDIQLRRQILEATLKRCGDTSEIPPPGKDQSFDQRLGEPRWQEPLYLMMAALIARQPGGLPEALSLTHTGLAFRLADRELDRIANFLPAGAPPESAKLLTHLAGVVTACRSLEPTDLISIAREESDVLGLEFPGGPGVAAARIFEALNLNGKLTPIEPDIIGESALLRVFGGTNGNEGAQALVRTARRASNRHASNVCFAIGRTCQDFASDQCLDPLDWVDEFIRAGESNDVDLLLALEAQLPVHTLILRERAARVDEALVKCYLQLQQTNPGERTQSTYAGFTNNFSIRLSDLGRYEEAVRHALEAVRIYRQLVKKCPDTYSPDLAGSLNSLSNGFSALGRREEALTHAEEALRIVRQLDQQRPGFLPDLAISLNNVANRLSNLGRSGEALRHAEEAIGIRRQLAQESPNSFLPDLAISLNNVANMLSTLGRIKEAHTGLCGSSLYLSPTGSTTPRCLPP